MLAAITNTRIRRARTRRALLLTVAASLALGMSVAAHAAEIHKEAKLDIAPGGTLNIINGCGSVVLHSGSGHQIIRCRNEEQRSHSR